ncbi:S41 family peptidase [Streptomyces sp. WMMC1477]|uniref:S41 family peptidase n=1 Tax=Streptomyces sp. WMMC1477 TaxID=3015155 RepID=UPI0022B5EACC|nr:S41 family peptidase [Streptomyces sp. WMMC1477]MCZ7430883.1 S41 family peptidase [Streptomyces sp. WMMC1477]
MLTNAQIIERALDRIGAGYVFPERVPVIDGALRRRLAAGEYEGLTGAALCAAVTAHLQEACPDQHLRLLWSDTPRTADEGGGQAAFRALLAAENQGVRRFEHLDGNIALLDVRRIADPGSGAPAIGAAMQLAAGSDALLFDLRACRGGSPEGAALWCSYFFPDGDVHLNDIHDRPAGTTRQYWTAAHLPAPRYLDRPVFVLTGPATFSGGEDVAYTLQAHGRAVVVGERTRGGAHPTERYPVTDHVTVTVPTARTVSTVTATNWEGTGVTPDIPAPAEEAPGVAHREALSRLRDGRSG